VGKGEVVALIGSNGAGKTTLLRTISGLLKPTAGSIRLGERDLRGVRPDRIVAAGISHSPEGRQVFAHMSVRENLLLGAYQRNDKAEIKSDADKCYALFPVLAERRDQRAGTLSGGEQQMLAMGRALMARPKLLLLDEPSLGLAPLLVAQIFSTIKEINRGEGVTVLLVEQNAYHALRLAHRGYVLVNGSIRMSGPGAELLANPDIQKAYLAGGHH
jgi:branched-chain amino acid transport system ATP-binding protein